MLDNRMLGYPNWSKATGNLFFLERVKSQLIELEQETIEHG